jgi:transposase
MWRFTRNNAITEGFPTKMAVLQRQAYGSRNFQNYRKRVKVRMFFRSAREDPAPFLA